MAISLQDKVVLITGASSGFGRDAAHLFAAEGAKVVLAARRIERLQTLADEIRDHGGEALVVPVDVAHQPEIELMVQTVIEIYDRIDILFNNAGFGRIDWFEDLDPERDIQTQIEINLTGLIRVTQAVLPHMIKRRQGHIINMASVSVLIPAPTYTVYAASKSGVRGFTNALRREMAGYNIYISGIYPGPSKTEFSWNSAGKNRRRRPGWFKHIFIPSERIARRVVELAQHPRRSVIMPWYFAPIGFFDFIIPGVVDWFVKVLYTNRM